MFPRNEQVKNTRGKPKMLSKLSIYLLRGDGLSRNALKNSYEKRRTTEKVMTSTNSGSSLCRGSPQIQIQIQIQIHICRYVSGLAAKVKAEEFGK